MEEMQPKIQNSDVETMLSDLTLHESIGTEMQTNESNWSQNLKTFPVAGSGLFAKELESGVIMSVCRQQ